MRARRSLYRAGLLRAHRLPVPVVSVGNLTVGGVGKTPFASLLLDRLPPELAPPVVGGLPDYGRWDWATVARRLPAWQG